MTCVVRKVARLIVAALVGSAGCSRVGTRMRPVVRPPMMPGTPMVPTTGGRTIPNPIGLSRVPMARMHSNLRIPNAVGRPRARGRGFRPARALPADIAAAEKRVDLTMWAAQKSREMGLPQAASLQEKAEEAIRALEMLKQSASSPSISAAPVVASKTVYVGEEVIWEGKKALVRFVGPVQFAQGDWVGLEVDQGGANDGSVFGVEYFKSAPGTGVFVQDTAKLKVLGWGEQPASLPTAAAQSSQQRQAQGMPQAASSQPVFPQQPAATQSSQSSSSFAPARQASFAPASSVTQQDLKKAKEEMELQLWAAQTAAAQGMPQAAALQAKAAEKSQAYEAMKLRMEQGEASPMPVPVAPSATSPVAPSPVPPSATSAAFGSPASVAPSATSPVSAPSAVSPASIVEAEKHAQLLAWAAKTASAKQLPQAGAMQAKADEAARALEALRKVGA